MTNQEETEQIQEDRLTAAYHRANCERRLSNHRVGLVALGALSVLLGLQLYLAGDRADRYQSAYGLACQGWTRISGNDSSDCPRALEILTTGK